MEDLQQWTHEEEQDHKESWDNTPQPSICETSHSQTPDRKPLFVESEHVPKGQRELEQSCWYRKSLINQ